MIKNGIKKIINKPILLVKQINDKIKPDNKYKNKLLYLKDKVEI